PSAPPVVNLSVPASPFTSLLHRPVLRGGLYAWALLGLCGIAVVASRAATVLSIVVVPLILALFPAAVLAPLVRRLTARRVPAAAATFLVLIGTLVVIGGGLAALVPAVASQVDGLRQSLLAGYEDLKAFLSSGPFGLQPIAVEDLLDRARRQLQESGANIGSGVFGALVVVTEGVAGVLFGVVALFFYLKDGPRLAEWLRDLFPLHLRADAAEVGVRAWQTVGAYVRGQLVIAVVDATLIGIGIVVLGVPLALPLIVVVFIGGLFPIVGAVVAGFIAVLAALATVGLSKALILLAVIVVVQQVEGDVLAPVVLGKATQLHPLATLVALAAGTVLLGVLGAFLSVPVAASGARAVNYLRSRERRRSASDELPPAAAAAA
ncbi:MAG: AI-2E family transporter, partial [Actinomycetota bacterium]|nr:AI-2E family transporter [Actinomycetota bacterium]